jgi:hypothetical protein
MQKADHSDPADRPEVLRGHLLLRSQGGEKTRKKAKQGIQLFQPKKQRHPADPHHADNHIAVRKKARNDYTVLSGLRRCPDDRIRLSGILSATRAK